VRRRLLIWALWLALLTGTAVGIGSWLVPGLRRLRVLLDDSVGVRHHASGPTLEQLLPLSSLTTLRVQVTDVTETHIEGLTGGITATVLVKGDVELSSNLARAWFEAVDEANRTAVLVLPHPRANRARLDHERTRIVALARGGLWTIVPGDYADQVVVNRAYADAERLVSTAAEGEALRDQARAQAERVLGSFFEAMNWRVRVRWGDGP
jgi:hypothetical protein